MISHHFPSFGDPFDLTVQQFFSIYDRLSELYEMKNPGPTDHREKMDRYRRRKRLEG